MGQLATTDPLAFLEQCREHYQANVMDYRGQLVKQERVSGKLSSEQEIGFRFREQPFSVDLRWTKNAGRARRINYVAGRWTEGGRDWALIEPSGLVGAVIPGGIKWDIHGREAVAESRKTVDQFGFKNSLDLIIQTCKSAQHKSGFELSLLGAAMHDGRPCYVLRRRLPFRANETVFSDRMLIIHIDQSWLVPVALYAYTDDEARELLGRYEFTMLQFNTGLTDADF